MMIFIFPLKRGDILTVSWGSNLFRKVLCQKGAHLDTPPSLTKTSGPNGDWTRREITSKRIFHLNALKKSWICFSGDLRLVPFTKSPSFTTIWENVKVTLSKHPKVANPRHSKLRHYKWYIYIANWVIIYHLPPIQGTRKLHWQPK